MRKIAWIGIMALALLGQAGLPLSAHAAEPRERVATMLTAISAVLHDPGLEGSAREGRVRAIIFDTFHFDEMAKTSLGSHWETLSSAQREKFVPLFGDFFEKSYNRLVLQFLGDRKTTYVAESVSEDVGVVRTVLEDKGNERLPVEYRLAHKGGRWGVVDVVLDGVSLARNFQVQFQKIIRTSSYRTLVERMKAKTK